MLPNRSYFNDYGTIDDFSDYINNLLGSASLNEALAEKHRTFWKLSNRPSFEDIGLSSTGDSFSDDTIETIKYHLEDSSSFSKLFSLSYSVIPVTTAADYGLTPSTGPSNSNGFLDYAGVRPNLGTASSLGVTASLSKNHDGSGNSKSYSLLSKLACIEYAGDQAHNFSSLPDEYMAATLRSVSLATPQCASCHTQYSDLATNVPMFEAHTSLGNWLTYNVANFLPGKYAGHDFDTEEDLSTFFENDPRFKTCEAINLIGDMIQGNQDRYTARDLYASVFKKLNKEDNLIEAVKALVASDDYSVQLYNPSTGTTTEPEEKSGLKFLQRHHLKGIINSIVMYPVIFDSETTTLYPSTADKDQIALPATLDLSSKNGNISTPYLPDETYMRSIFQLANELSKKIVEDELAAGTLAASRKVFTYLSDGTPTAANVETQIINLWFNMTSIVISNSSTTYTELKSIYDTASTESGLTTAWQAVLYAVLVSPEFLSY